MPPHPMCDPRTRSLLVAAGKTAGRITVEYRPSAHASLLDDSDPANPIIVLNPDEPDETLMAEVVDQCRALLERAMRRDQHARTHPDLELVPYDDEEMPVAVNDSASTSELSVRSRRMAFEVLPGGAV